MLDDLRAWWPKLCPGALVVGHDWTFAVPNKARGLVRRRRHGVTAEYTPKHPVATAVRRFLLELEPEEEAADAPRGNVTRNGTAAANATVANGTRAKTLLRRRHNRTQRLLGIYLTADHPASFILMKAPDPACAVVA